MKLADEEINQRNAFNSSSICEVSHNKGSISKTGQKMDFTQAARAAGQPRGHMQWRPLLPNTLGRATGGQGRKC